MTDSNNSIGVLDTGVGGLTVVKELRKLLPYENIIYIGDSINCPYGNKNKNEIKNLTLNMFDFLQNQNIKVAAVACNTISSALEEFNDIYDFKIKGIVIPAANYVINNNIKNIGVFATSFTVNTGCYHDYLKSISPNINVISKSSACLAALIEQGDFSSQAMKEEIKSKIEEIISISPHIKDIILACTHYPIVLDVFNSCFPNINFINPAFEQAVTIKKFLEENNLLKNSGQGTTSIYTTGNTELIKNVSNKIGIQNDSKIKKIQL